MRPIEIPPGTTIPSFVEEVLVREHRTHVLPGSSAEPISALAKIEGVDGGVWHLTASGCTLTVKRGEHAGGSFWLVSDKASVQYFLDDAIGPGLLLPEISRNAAIVPLTDPRLWKRMAMIQGSLVIELVGVPEGPPRLWLGFGAGRHISPFDVAQPSVRVQVPYGMVQELKSQPLRPEKLIDDDRLKLEGNRLTALQAALALSLLWPVRA